VKALGNVSFEIFGSSRGSNRSKPRSFPPAVKFAKLFRQVVVAERSVIFPETEGLAANHGVHDEAQDARRPGAAGGISALRLPGAAARCWYLAKVLR
jgi:hypothetical protein